MSDRLTKQELRADPLMDQTAKAADALSHHGKTIVAGIIALVVVVAAIMIFKGNAASSQANAAELLAEVRVAVQNGAQADATAKLEELISSYGGTSSGKQARLILADLRFNEGNSQEAANLYREALDGAGGDNIMAQSARRGLAASLANLSQFSAAAAEYKTLAETSSNNRVDRDELYLAAGRNYAAAGNTSEAIAMYKMVADSNVASRSKDVAKIRLAELEMGQ